MIKKNDQNDARVFRKHHAAWGSYGTVLKVLSDRE